jgi:hypothetical protein
MSNAMMARDYPQGNTPGRIEKGPGENIEGRIAATAMVVQELLQQAESLRERLDRVLVPDSPEVAHPSRPGPVPTMSKFAEDIEAINLCARATQRVLNNIMLRYNG